MTTKRQLDLGYTPSSCITNGVVEYQTPNDMYLGVLRDFLENAPVVSRKGRLYLSFKPYCFRVKDPSNTMIMLPGSNYHDPIPWLFSELFDWLHGPVVAGGRSVRFDKHRRTVYPKGNGEDDWSYKSAFGQVGGQGQLDWARRHLSIDSTSRSCVMSPWSWEKDLVRYTARKEEGLGNGDEYQRLPCIVSVQMSADDTLEYPYKKGVNVMCHQRALDFTGAIHTDLFRIAESAQWAASGAYPNGMSGSLTFMAGTCVVESFGAQRFVEFRNLLEWWTNTPSCLNILDQYPVTNQCFSNPVAEGAPKQKSYVWFREQWHLLELCVQNAIKGQWNLFEERVNKIQYQYYKDFAYLMAVFEYELQYDLKPEILAYHWDAPQFNRAQEWAASLGKYPTFYLLGKIKNWFKYMASAYLCYVFVQRKDYDRLNELLCRFKSNHRNKDNLLMDASRFLNKQQRNALFSISEYKEFGSLYRRIFEDGKD